MISKQDKKITLKVKLMYGSGDIFGGGAFLVISLLFMNYLTDVQLLNPFLAGLACSIGKGWDALIDPILGMLSDRTRTRFGRRRVFFLIGIIPISLSFFMLWYSFGISSQAGMFIYFMFAYILFSTVFSMVMIPYSSILPDMTTNYKDRSSLSGFRMIFSAASAIAAGVLPKMMINSFGGNIKLGYIIMGLCFGVVYALPWIVVFLGTWENPEYEHTENVKINVLEEIKTSFRNRSFKLHSGMFICSQTAVDFMIILFTYYLTYCLNRPKEFSAVLGVLLVTQLIFMPIHIKVSRRYGKTTPLKIGLLLWIFALVCSLFLKENMNNAFVYIIAIISAAGTSASVFVPWSILPEVADVDELISSRRREGIYSGMATFLRQAANAITMLMVGIVLNWVGYIPNKKQVLSSLIGIKVLFSIAPILFIVLALYFARNYTMTEDKYNVLMKEIKRRKRGGKAEDVTNRVRRVCEELTGLSYEKLWNNKASMYIKDKGNSIRL